MGVGPFPSATPREGATPGTSSTSGVSPNQNYQQSPAVMTATSAYPQPSNMPGSAAISPSSNFKASPITTVPGVAAIQPNPTMHHPVPAHTGGLLPSLPVEAGPSKLKRLSPGHGPTSVVSTPYASPAQPGHQVHASTGDYPMADVHPGHPLDMPTPPPLVHSHSYPSTLPHQYPHGIPTPISPLHPSASASIAAAMHPGLAGHMPMVSSPLATMPISSRPTTPTRYFDGQWPPATIHGMSTIDGSMVHTPTDGPMPGFPPPASAPGPSRRVSQTESVRSDGRPVINRSRSSSVATKSWSTLPGMTAGAPPSAWTGLQNLPPMSGIMHGMSGVPPMGGMTPYQAVHPAQTFSSGAGYVSGLGSRAVSPDSDDEDSEEEVVGRKPKRRRSSAGKDDSGMDLSFQNGPTISEDVRRQLDQIFEDFLNKVCSDCELLSTLSRMS